MPSNPRRLGVFLSFLAMVSLSMARVEASEAARAADPARVAVSAPAAGAASPATRPPRVHSRNAIVFDPHTEEVLYEKNASLQVPIASITKLMTALVYLNQEPDLSHFVQVTRADLLGAGHTQLVRGERIKLGDLLHMSLMCSDNAATRVLVRESGIAADLFLSQMNRKAVELGLTHTRFVEFTGLDEGNVSTASDVARMLRAASDNYLIRDISTTVSYEFKSKTRLHRIPNTNRLVHNQRLQILGGKTGFISKAGYCLATWVRAGERDVIAVVLGAPTNATRFADAVRLIWGTIPRPPRSES